MELQARFLSWVIDRPRMRAWIEMPYGRLSKGAVEDRPRMRAWIEISHKYVPLTRTLKIALV